MPRHLVTRPGESSADVLASAEFSAWLQPADQVADAVALTSAPEPADVGGYFKSYDDYVLDPPVPDDDAVAETTALAVELSSGGDSGTEMAAAGMLRVSHTAWTLGGSAPGDDDPFQYSHVLHGDRGGDGTTIAASAQDLTWRDAWRDDWPLGAIGYEVELTELEAGFWVPIAEPVSAEFEITLAPTTYFGHVANAEAIAVLNTQWGEGPVAWGYAPATSPPLLDMGIQRLAPATLAAADDDHYARVVRPVPETGETDPPYVETVTIEDLSACPPYTGLVGLHSTVKNLGQVMVDNGATLEVSADSSISGIYAIRPPRIRWIYEDAPICRTYPRDDGLAGGAPRTWPPSKAVQSSNRTWGGYL